MRLDLGMWWYDQLFPDHVHVWHKSYLKMHCVADVGSLCSRGCAWVWICQFNCIKIGSRKLIHGHPSQPGWKLIFPIWHSCRLCQWFGFHRLESKLCVQVWKWWLLCDMGGREGIWMDRNGGEGLPCTQLPKCQLYCLNHAWVVSVGPYNDLWPIPVGYWSLNH